MGKKDDEVRRRKVLVWRRAYHLYSVEAVDTAKRTKWSLGSRIAKDLVHVLALEKQLCRIKVSPKRSAVSKAHLHNLIKGHSATRKN
jgi:hypothetical protein